MRISFNPDLFWDEILIPITEYFRKGLLSEHRHFGGFFPKITQRPLIINANIYLKSSLTRLQWIFSMIFTPLFYRFNRLSILAEPWTRTFENFREKLSSRDFPNAFVLTLNTYLILLLWFIHIISDQLTSGWLSTKKSMIFHSGHFVWKFWKKGYSKFSTANL